MTAALLLNVEETSCTVDLALVGEMRRFGLDLRAFRELSRLEEGCREGKESLLDRAARSPQSFGALQAGFKARPQCYLPANPVSSGMAAVPIPPDLGDWCHPETQRFHAGWAEKLARRIWNPVFQRFVGLLPQQPGHLENAYRFINDVWKRGELILPVAEPSEEERERNVSLYRLRYLVIRAAELAVKLSKAGAATEELLDDLTAWALAVVNDLVQAKRESFEAHAAAVRALLARHQIEDGGGKLSASFDDHVERHQDPEARTTAA